MSVMKIIGYIAYNLVSILFVSSFFWDRVKYWRMYRKQGEDWIRYRAHYIFMDILHVISNHHGELTRRELVEKTRKLSENHIQSFGPRAFRMEIISMLATMLFMSEEPDLRHGMLRLNSDGKVELTNKALNRYSFLRDKVGLWRAP